MSAGLRSNLLKFMVDIGLFPADTLLLYDDNAFEWNSGFGDFALVLYSFVRSAKPDVIVEVGSAYGKSTCFIAAALQRNQKGKLFSIDPHEKTKWNDGDESIDTFQIVSKRLQELRLTPHVEILKAYSSQVYQNWNRKIDILLLDGAHSYQDVKADFYGFLPNLNAGSLIIFHDTMWEYHRDSTWYRDDQGVPRLVQELMGQGYPTVTLQEGWGLSILQNSPGGFCLMPDCTDTVINLK